MIQILKAVQLHAVTMRNVTNKTFLMMLLECKSKKYNVFHYFDGQVLTLVGLLEQGFDFEALEMIETYHKEMLFVIEL
jgi:hypothetical protein